MKIELKEIKINEVANGYFNDNEEGVVGFGGKLNIRPKYQREFVYKDKQRDSVIETVQKNFPLNVMYWVKNEDETYEVLDGQQRTISISQFVEGDFAFKSRYFHNLQKDEQEEAYAALKTVKAELNEVNLLNAKLLYTNKIFRSKSLTESQKVKVLTAFDKAINVKEVKLVYESLLENLTTTKKSVNENLLSSASKTISGIKNTKQPIVESNEMVKRFQKLAGIK